MDQVYVEASLRDSGTALEREFFSDFPLLLNYVARLTDNLDIAPAIACEAFRQVAGRAHAGSGSGGLRVDLFRTATELSRQALRPRRWFRRQRTTPMVLAGFPDTESRRSLRRDTVQRALAALSFDARATVLLRDFVKLSYEELSQILTTPLRKLVHVLDRGRAELTEIYDYIKF